MFSHVKYGMNTFTHCIAVSVVLYILCLKFQFLVTVMRNIMAGPICSKIMRLFLTYRCIITRCNGTHIYELNSSLKKITSIFTFSEIETGQPDRLYVEWSNNTLTLILLMWTKWRAPTNASKWRMGFNSAFKGLIMFTSRVQQR